jgi:hypothetical protein
LRGNARKREKPFSALDGVISSVEYGVKMDDEVIRELVKRLARPHASGGAVIERAAIIAEGADFASVMEWIAQHNGQPEMSVASVSTRGLHGAKTSNMGREQRRPPLRYVLPAGTLS